MTENIRPQASVLCKVPSFIVLNAIFRRLAFFAMALKETVHPHAFPNLREFFKIYTYTLRNVVTGSRTFILQTKIFESIF